MRAALAAFRRTAPLEGVVVAVSGGADSMALLHGLHAVAAREGLRLTVAHLHHGLRGAAADRDARFVRAAARALGLPCVVGRADVAAQARAAGLSIEMAARRARYAFLVRTARRVARGRPVAIATAHTVDDQAETVLLRLARGAGLRGLAGIPPERWEAGVRVIRPLLHVRRAALRRGLRTGGHAWCEDETNRDPGPQRNRVRLELLPALARALNPRVTEALARTAALLRDDEAWLETLTDSLLPTLLDPPPAGGEAPPPAIIVSALAAVPVAARRRVVRRWLAMSGVVPERLDAITVEAVLRLAGPRPRGGGVRSSQLPGGGSVRRQGDRLEWWSPASATPRPPAPPAPAVLKTPGVTLLPDWGLRVTIAPTDRVLRVRPPGLGVLPAAVTLAARRLGRRRLRLRAWQPGDRLAPLGMTGHQKLQDLFVNAKIPRDARARIPLLVCGPEIVWIPGHRLARGWEVSAGDTRILQIDCVGIR